MIIKTYRGGTFLKAGRIRKQGSTKAGYKIIILARNGGYVASSVHRLVAKTFLGNPPSGMVVCHNNGNKIDNRVVNLRYATSSENAHDKIKHGTHRRGETVGTSKLKDSDAIEIIKLARAGTKHKIIAQRFGITADYVSEIATGKSRAWQLNDETLSARGI
jgi:hypothetical protein